MAIPGFSANASLYRICGCYQTGGDTLKALQASYTVCPQLQVPRLMTRRPRGPEGTIGLPGQNCEQACWHVCATFTGSVTGPFFTKCLEDCVGQCSFFG
jgi:hypothetical protein